MMDVLEQKAREFLRLNQRPSKTMVLGDGSNTDINWDESHAAFAREIVWQIAKLVESKETIDNFSVNSTRYAVERELSRLASTIREAFGRKESK